MRAVLLFLVGLGLLGAVFYLGARFPTESLRDRVARIDPPADPRKETFEPGMTPGQASAPVPDPTPPPPAPPRPAPTDLIPEPFVETDVDPEEEPAPVPVPAPEPAPQPVPPVPVPAPEPAPQPVPPVPVPAPEPAPQPVPPVPSPPSETELAFARLEPALAAARNALGPERSEALTANQGLWEQYWRDASEEARQVHGTDYEAVVVRLIDQRTETLTTLAKGAGGAPAVPPEELEAAEAELNRLHDALRQLASPDLMVQIRLAQISWLAYRTGTAEAAGETFRPWATVGLTRQRNEILAPMEAKLRAAQPPAPEPQPEPTPTPQPEPTPTPQPEPTPTPQPEPTPTPQPEPTPTPQPAPGPLDEPLPDPDSKPKPADLDYIDLKPLRISKAAVAHIVHFETGGRSYYEAQYQRPQWPGYSSGVTIGFGYDLGYTSKDQIRADWTGRVDPSELDAMLKVQGVTGSSAKFLASEIRNQVRISWEKAQGVFEQSTLPRWSKATSEAYVLGRSELPPDCNGALIGNTFNRGTAMSPEGKQREKWLIREAIRLRNWSAIPALLREQRKHWPNTSGPNGLQTRRSQEAELFEKGLQAMKDGTFPPLSYLQEDRSSGTGRSYGRNDVVGPRHPIWRTEEIHPALIARKNRILGIGRDGEHRDTIRAGTLYAASAAAYAAEQIGYHLFVTSGNRWGVSSSPNHGQNKDLGDAIDFVITDKPDGSGKTLEGTDGKRQTYEILAAAAVAAARDKTKPGVGVGWGRTNGAGHHIEVDDSQRGTPDAADVWPYSDSGDSAFLVFERDWASGKILADDKYAFYWDYFHGKPADTAGAQ